MAFLRSVIAACAVGTCRTGVHSCGECRSSTASALGMVRWLHQLRCGRGTVLSEILGARPPSPFRATRCETVADSKFRAAGPGTPCFLTTAWRVRGLCFCAGMLRLRACIVDVTSLCPIPGGAFGRPAASSLFSDSVKEQHGNDNASDRSRGCLSSLERRFSVPKR